jgi:predicted transcriptional regulator
VIENKLPPYNPNPAYLRGLIDKIGLSQQKIAGILQIPPSVFRKYITYTDNKSYQQIKYRTQLALEYLALISDKKD